MVARMVWPSVASSAMCSMIFRAAKLSRPAACWHWDWTCTSNAVLHHAIRCSGCAYYLHIADPYAFERIDLII